MLKSWVVLGISTLSLQASADATNQDIVDAVNNNGKKTVEIIESTSEKQYDNAHYVAGQIIDAVNDAFLDYKTHWTEYYTRSLNEERDYQNKWRFMIPPYNTETIKNGLVLKEIQDKREKVTGVMDNLLLNWNGYSESENHYLDASNRNNNSIVYTRFAKVCSVKDMEWGLCIPKGNTLTPDNPEDVLASSILGKTKFNEQEAKLAHFYMQNVTNPNPKQMMSMDELFIDKENKVFSRNGLANMESWIKNMSLMSLAQASFVDSISKRIPIEIQDPEDPDKTYYESEYSVLDNEANRRLTNTEWVKQINQMSTEALLREITFILAANLSLTNELRKDIEAIKLNSAAQTAAIAQEN